VPPAAAVAATRHEWNQGCPKPLRIAIWVESLLMVFKKKLTSASRRILNYFSLYKLTRR
jgi:hypothetical protein